MHLFVWRLVWWLVTSPSAEPDELLVSIEGVPLISLNTVPSVIVLVSDVPVGVPQLSDGILYNNSLVELEGAARELGTVFFDFFGISEPFLQVLGNLRVWDALIMMSGCWGSCSLTSSKQPLSWAQLVPNPRGVSILEKGFSKFSSATSLL